MSHSLARCWLHALWSTKNREFLIKEEVEQLIYHEINKQFRVAGCYVRITNGMPDHIHSLFLLNPTKSIAEVIQIVKGIVSQWINEQDLIPEKFAWQTGYAAYSVSESQVEKVYNYIKNQKEHHKTKTLQQELDQLNALHKLNGNPNKKSKLDDSN